MKIDWMIRRGRAAIGRIESRIDAARGRTPRTQLVICGYPRSGTSLLYNMLASCLPTYHHDAFEHSCLKYVDQWRDTVSKRPLDIFKIEALAGANHLGKRLVIVVLIRDPRDIVTSRHPRVPDEYFIGWEHCYRVNGPNGPEAVHPGIDAISREIERLEALPGIELFRVRYEELVADPDAAQAALETATGLAFEGRFADFHEADQLAYQYAGERAARDTSLVLEDQPVDASRAGKWQAAEHLPRVRGEFSRHPELLELVIRYGYAEDDAWFSALGSAADPG
jgi:hypothetical protein